MTPSGSNALRGKTAVITGAGSGIGLDLARIAARFGTLVAEESIQLHGGIGMTWELPLSHYAKRLVMIDHQLGDEDHHLARYMTLNEEN